MPPEEERVQPPRTFEALFSQIQKDEEDHDDQSEEDENDVDPEDSSDRSKS